MTRLIFLIPILFLIISCAQDPQDTKIEADLEFHGERFELASIIPATELPDLLSEEKTETIRVEGTVIEVCQTKGCWLTLETGTDEHVRITFKDYGFFVPKDIAGKHIVLEGHGWLNKTSVNTLRHYAEDAGEPEEVIAAITEPKTELYFEASGVFIR